MIEVLEGEIWKDVKEYEGKYRISSYGRLTSINGRYKGEVLMKPSIGKKEGYYITCLRKPDIKKVYFRIHTLVSNAFHPIIDPEKSFIDHLDGNKLNNYAGNLERVTPAENVRRAIEKGLFNTKGSKHTHSKLNEEKVIEMRRLYKTGLTQKAISIMFGVCRRQAGDVINGVNWKHI